MSLSDPHSNLSRGLLVWYALFQTGHAGLNARYLVRDGPLPFAPPPEGWLPQTVAFMNAGALADLINAVLAIVFVVGFFRGARWAAWLGTVTLTVSMYAAVLFTLGIVQLGGWAFLASQYWWVYAPFVPVVVLFAAWSDWAAHGKLAR